MASSCSIVSMAVTTNAAPCVETGYHAVDDPAGSFILYMRIQGTARPTVCRRSQRLVGQREPHQHESGCPEVTSAFVPARAPSARKRMSPPDRLLQYASAFSSCSIHRP